ncbi:MAG: hypothetical protein HC935_09480 [Pseudanabaena sp. SU_2_4]|nr:hypothetical protein [Pseudanabaena sp. SU_2_4]
MRSPSLDLETKRSHFHHILLKEKRSPIRFRNLSENKIRYACLISNCLALR